MKQWGWLALVLTLTACSSATGSLYGNGGGGGGGGGSDSSGPPYTVTYKVDAVHNGSPPVDSMSPYPDGSTVTVKGQGNLTWDPFPFIGWTTKDPGSNGLGDNGGTHYNPNDTFVIHSNMTLWAAWGPAP